MVKERILFPCHLNVRSDKRRKPRMGWIVCAVAIGLFVSFAPATGLHAQDYVRVVPTIEAVPEIRTPRMKKAWHIYENYRDAQIKIKSMLASIAISRGDLDAVTASGIFGAVQIVNFGDDVAALQNARSELRKAQETAELQLRLWEGSGFYADTCQYALGPLEDANHDVVVRYGGIDTHETKMDLIKFRLIQWDQEVAKQALSSDTGVKADQPSPAVPPADKPADTEEPSYLDGTWGFDSPKSPESRTIPQQRGSSAGDVNRLLKQ